MIGGSAVAVALVAGAFAAVLLLTAEAPPPPRFGGAGEPEFAPAIDGSWYSDGCRRFEIAGGWLLPPQQKVALASGYGQHLVVAEPIDLTRLRTDGTSIAFAMPGSARLSIRWQSGALRIEGTAGGKPVDVRLVRRGSARC